MKYYYQIVKHYYYTLTFPKPYNDSSHLQIHEWFAIALICGVMLGLIFASRLPEYTNKYSDIYMTVKEKSPVDVSVKGCVEKPGVYEVPADTTVEEFLKMAAPKPEAKQRTKGNKNKLRQGQSIRVAKKAKKSAQGTIE